MHALAAASIWTAVPPSDRDHVCLVPRGACLLQRGSGSSANWDSDGTLQRQGSMNLPRPEDSGVPATHADMCILRIRRNHLIEVGCFPTS